MMAFLVVFEDEYDEELNAGVDQVFVLQSRRDSLVVYQGVLGVQEEVLWVWHRLHGWITCVGQLGQSWHMRHDRNP